MRCTGSRHGDRRGGLSKEGCRSPICLYNRNWGAEAAYRVWNAGDGDTRDGVLAEIEVGCDGPVEAPVASLHRATVGNRATA